MIICT